MSERSRHTVRWALRELTEAAAPLAAACRHLREGGDTQLADKAYRLLDEIGQLRDTVANRLNENAPSTATPPDIAKFTLPSSPIRRPVPKGGWGPSDPEEMG